MTQRLIDASRLARFRADPGKVRVAVRCAGDGWWLVQVRTRRDHHPVTLTRRTRSPSVGILRLLVQAEAVGMDGIDLWMDWAYKHPQRSP